MFLSHKIELRPTPDQAEYLDKACGSKRHCYNQLLEHFSKPENKWSRRAGQDYYKQVLKKEFDWYAELSVRVTRNAVEDLNDAYTNFFRRVKANQVPGYPKFKRKGVKDSFALRESDRFTVVGREIRLERLPTRIKMREKLRFEGKPKQVTISKRAGKYYASILVDTEDYDPKDTNHQTSVGVDLGIENLAVLSTGQVFEANQKLKASLDKLAKLQRSISRKQKGSNRQARAKLKVAKLHFRIYNQRRAALHNLSSYLTSNFNLITMEDLAIFNMVKNRRFSRSISDASWGELRRQIEYKAKLRNCEVVVADRWYPSSKTCSCCGVIKAELPLSERTYSCECGLEMDRDLNAAKNLNEYGVDKLQPTTKRTKELSKTESNLSVSVDVVNKPS